MSWRLPAWAELTVLIADAVILAVIEVFFLPLRFDGLILPDLGSWPFPITALIAAISTPWLIRRAATISSRLSVAGAPLFAWLIAVLVIGYVGPENTTLLQDWRTLLLLGCAALPSAIVLGNILGVRRRAALSAAKSSPSRASSGSSSSSGNGGAARSRAGRKG